MSGSPIIQNGKFIGAICSNDQQKDILNIWELNEKEKELQQENDRLQNTVERKDAEIAALKRQIEERNIQDKEKELEKQKAKEAKAKK